MAKTMGQKVRIERVTLGLSQAELAQRVGISRGYISDIERDSERINIGKDVIISLADALGVSVAYIMGLSEDPLAGLEDEEPADETPPVQTLDKLTKEFLSIFQQLDDNKRATLLDLAKMLRSADAPRIIGEDS